jgi:hypothetical protein
MVLMPAYAKEILNGGSDMLGFLMSATGAGALTGAIFLAARNSVLGLGKIISIFTILLGLAIISASFSKLPVLSLLVFFMAGFSMILAVAAINTMLHALADEDKRPVYVNKGILPDARETNPAAAK